jgi:hypothetical protein
MLAVHRERVPLEIVPALRRMLSFAIPPALALGYPYPKVLLFAFFDTLCDGLP